MSTTNIELRNWLKRFPDDAEIKVLTSSEGFSCGQYYTNVYEEDLELPDVEIVDLTWMDKFPTVEFDISFDYDIPVCNGVKSITLGRKDD